MHQMLNRAISVNHPFRYRLCTILLPALALMPGIAIADQQDTFNFSLGAALTYEDNLFKLPDSANAKIALGKSQKSDLVFTSNAGISIDKLYAQQRFQIDAAVVDHRYDTFSNLDYTAFNYRLAWLWHLTPNITGLLAADQQQVLNNFSEFRNFNNQLNQAQSIQTNETRVFNVDALIGGGIHLLGGVSQIRSRNSRSFEAVGDYVQDGGEFGVKYVAPSDNSIALVHRESTGDYGRTADVLSQLDSGFNQSETEAQLYWQFTGKSAINARLGYIDRTHDHFSSRDYDGVNGRIAYTWLPTGKLRVNASLARDYYSYQQAINSYFIADTFSIGPTWQITAKTTMRLRYDYSHRDYFGAIIPIPVKRNDNLQLFQVAADWQPTRTIQVTGSLQHEDRGSNATASNGLGGDLDYDDNSVTISAKLLF